MIVGYVFGVFLAIAHNGIVHKPLESSSILVGPSFVCGNCYTVYNYGMNYIYHVTPTGSSRMNHNTSYFPIAVATLQSGVTFAVVDVGTSFQYSINNSVIEKPEGCPEAKVSKFYRESDTLILFDLITGNVYSVSKNASSCNLTAFWNGTIYWETYWKSDPSDNTESPVFYSYQRHQGCTYFFIAGPTTKVISNDCNFSTPKLNDATGGSEIHSGGDLFIFKNRLALANGETSNDFLLSRSQFEDYFAGKVIFVDDLSIAAAGLRHPWTAVALDNGSVAVADVGQLHSEDVSILNEVNTNFGYPMIEGALAITPWTYQSKTFTNHVLPSFVDNRPTPKYSVLAYTWSMFGLLLFFFVLEWYFWGFANFLLLAAALTLCPRIAVVPDTHGYVNFASISTVSMYFYRAWSSNQRAMLVIYTFSLLLCAVQKWWAGIPLLIFMVGWSIALPRPWVLTLAAPTAYVVLAGVTFIYFLKTKMPDGDVTGASTRNGVKTERPKKYNRL